MKRKQMTVAFVSDAIAPFNKGGKETRIYFLTRELARRGYDVHIYTMKWWDGDNKFSKDNITYHAISKFHGLYNGERRSVKQGVIFGLACFKLIFESFDIIEVDHIPVFPLFAAKVVCLIKRRALYATWHEVWGKYYWQTYLGYFSGSVAYYLERASVFMPNHIIAVSRHTADQLKSVLHYSGPLSLVTNGIDYNQIAPIKPSRTKSDVIYAGRLLKHKRVDLLVDAVAELSSKQPDISCLIIGDGPEYKTIENSVIARGLQKNIKMMGFLNAPDEVFALMKSSKVFVLPSEREGFGISVIEAIACGLSVVTINHPDNAARYLVSDPVGIVCNESSTAIASSIKTLLARADSSAPDFARLKGSYDWSQSVYDLMEVYAP